MLAPRYAIAEDLHEQTFFDKPVFQQKTPSIA